MQRCWRTLIVSLARSRFTVLAEEEFAKAFILYLVEMEVIPWTKEITRSLNDHSSKHLMGIVVDWITTFISDFFTELGRNRRTTKLQTFHGSLTSLTR